MAERPILFSGPMVRAILAGKKTQTRRLVRPAPGLQRTWLDERWIDCVRSGRMAWSNGSGVYGWEMDHPAGDGSPGNTLGFIASPYGGPGDRLWTKETWASGYTHGCLGTLFRADGAFVQGTRKHERGPRFNVEDTSAQVRWRPSIYMPRWASRLTLVVEAVRVERLQTITEEDAVAEGATCWACGGPVDGTSESECHCYHTRSAARDSFAALWDAINGKHTPWAENPYVWVVSFRREK